jgi:hypothetical protein
MRGKRSGLQRRGLQASRTEKNGAEGPHQKGGMLGKFRKKNANRFGVSLQVFHKPRRVTGYPGNVAREHFT